MKLLRAQRVVLMVLAALSVFVAVIEIADAITHVIPNIIANPPSDHFLYFMVLPLYGGVLIFAGVMCWCAWATHRTIRRQPTFPPR
jgi:hypothetical protein